MILPAFFARVKPASTIAKPHCMKNTIAVPTKNHTPKVRLDAASINSAINHSPPKKFGAQGAAVPLHAVVLQTTILLSPELKQKKKAL